MTDFAPRPQAHWEQQHGIYTLEIFADQASVAIFGDEAEATAYVIRLMLPRNIQSGTYEFFGPCGATDATVNPCLDLDVYDGRGETQSGHVEITREGDTIGARYSIVSYVDESFEGPVHDAVTVSGAFEGVTLPPSE